MKKHSQDNAKSGKVSENKSEHLQSEEDQAAQGKAREGVRDGRKSLTMPKSYGGKNKVRYIEGTKALKDGCWLSDK